MAAPGRVTPEPPDALAAKFRDFDSEEVHNFIRDHGEDDKAQNFVVRFGAEKAFVATNLNALDFKTLLFPKTAPDTKTPIRWM